MCSFTKKSKKNPDLDIYFKMKDGILYGYCKNVDGREISQVVVPKGLRCFDDGS